MGLIEPRSEVVTTGDGWVWLHPEPSSLRRSQVLAWALLTLTLGAGAAGVAFLDRLAGAAAAVAAVAAAVVLIRVATRSAHTRAGASRVGLLVQAGTRIVQAGWTAVAEVRMLPAAARRVRVVVATDQGPAHATRATFDAEAAGAWLERAAAQARDAGEEVELLDGGPSFAVR